MNGPPHIVVSGAVGACKATLLRGLGNAWPGAVAIEERRERFVDAYYRDSAFDFPNQVDYAVQFLSGMIRSLSGISPLVSKAKTRWDCTVTMVVLPLFNLSRFTALVR